MLRPLSRSYQAIPSLFPNTDIFGSINVVYCFDNAKIIYFFTESIPVKMSLSYLSFC